MLDTLTLLNMLEFPIKLSPESLEMIDYLSEKNVDQDVSIIINNAIKRHYDIEKFKECLSTLKTKSSSS